MSDLISRQNAIDVFEILADKMSDAGKTVMAQAVAVLKDLQSAESERIVKVMYDDTSVTDANGYKYYMMEYFCDACKKRVMGGDKYCSHCGARLDWSWNHE